MSTHDLFDGLLNSQPGELFAGQGIVGQPLTREQSIANLISGLGPGQTFGVTPQPNSPTSPTVRTNPTAPSAPPPVPLGAPAAAPAPVPTPAAPPVPAPTLGPPNSTGGPPFVETGGSSAGGGTDFSPDFRFNIDPNDPNSNAAFINSLLGALGPGLASGEFSNFFQQQGATGNQNQQTATNLFSQLSGGDPFRTLLRNSGAGALSDPLGNNTPGLQSFLENQLRSSIEGGGISQQAVQAQRDRILRPALEAQAGRNNRQGGGSADVNSPVFQELNRRLESDFLADQQIQASQNLQSQFGQAGELGFQQFGQGLANRQFGAGAQGQLAGQTLDLGSMLSQLGLGQQGLDLQNQGQRNEFGLGQSAIGSDILQTMMAGREGGGGLGTILALLTAAGGGSGIADLIPGIIDIFRGGSNPDTGEGTNPPTTHPPGTDTGGFTLPPDLIPGLIDIFFPGGLGGGGIPGSGSLGIPGTSTDIFNAANSGRLGFDIPPWLLGGGSIGFGGGPLGPGFTLPKDFIFSGE